MMCYNPNMIDGLILVEFIELMLCLFYLIVISRAQHDDRLTQVWFWAAAVALGADIFFFHRIRPEWVKWALNVPAAGICYEKILRKYTVAIARRLSAFLLALFG